MQCLVFALIFWSCCQFKKFQEALIWQQRQWQPQLFRCQGHPELLAHWPSNDLKLNASHDVFGPSSATYASLLLVLDCLVPFHEKQSIWSNAHILLADTMALMRHLLNTK